MIFIVSFELKVIDCRICGDPHSVLRFAFVEFADECKSCPENPTHFKFSLTHTQRLNFFSTHFMQFSWSLCLQMVQGLL